jgi:ABC-2 type transport system permease protein
VLPTARAAQVVGLLLFFAMFFISGGGPPEPIPDAVATAADALPMAYAVDVLQRGRWTGTWDLTGLLVQAGVLVAATAVAVWRLTGPVSRPERELDMRTVSTGPVPRSRDPAFTAT